MEIFWELHQRRHVLGAQINAIQAKDAASRLQFEVDVLKRKNDTLMLACQALWEIVRERDGLTDEQLRQRMQEIDLRDGTVDGKMSMVAVACPSCSRKSNSRHSKCVYCGAQLPAGHAFGKG